MGDINGDLLQDNIKRTWLKYRESFGLYQIIEYPTGVKHKLITYFVIPQIIFFV